jgi:biopolymer transport protein ExbD
MQLRRKSRMTSEVSTSSLNDIMFFLMLFFLIMSTFMNPNVIKVVLPKSEAGKALAKQPLTVSIDAAGNFYLNKKQLAFSELEPLIAEETKKFENVTMIIHADSSVRFQPVVDVISLGSKLDIKVAVATAKK